MVVDFILEAGIILAKIMGTILMIAGCVAIYKLEAHQATE